jgi:hypothetical protein
MCPALATGLHHDGGMCRGRQEPLLSNFVTGVGAWLSLGSKSLWLLETRQSTSQLPNTIGLTAQTAARPSAARRCERSSSN